VYSVFLSMGIIINGLLLMAVVYLNIKEIKYLNLL
jgi:hypothetical protein